MSTCRYFRSHSSGFITYAFHSSAFSFLVAILHLFNSYCCNRCMVEIYMLHVQKPFLWPIVTLLEVLQWKTWDQNAQQGNVLVQPLHLPLTILDEVALELDASISVQGTTKPSDFPPIYTVRQFQPYKHRRDRSSVSQIRWPRDQKRYLFVPIIIDNCLSQCENYLSLPPNRYQGLPAGHLFRHE